MYRTLQTAVGLSRQKRMLRLTMSVLSCLVIIFSSIERAGAAAGGLDTTFNPGGSGVKLGFNATPASVQAFAVLPDGKILVGGNFKSYNGLVGSPAGIMRLNPDGTLDTSFNLFGTGANDMVSAIAVQPDGKILIGGKFTRYNRNNPEIPDRIARLTPDGFVDSSFNCCGFNKGANGPVGKIFIQPDGKIIIVGSFNKYNNIETRGFIRLNANGTKDTSFPVGVGADVTPAVMAVQADGKILIGGSFTRWQGDYLASNGIARLNANWTLDTSFNYFPPNGAPGVGKFGNNGSVTKIAVQAHGKILISGNFSDYNNDPATPNMIARLNSNGSLDTSFNPGGVGANGTILFMTVLADGKILIGGEFSRYNDAPTTSRQIARLNANGTLDTSFNPGGAGVAPSNSLRAMAVQGDGKILIGGRFTSYNGDTAISNGIARLNGDL